MHPFTHTKCNLSSNLFNPTNWIPTFSPWPPFQLQHWMWITCLTEAKPPDTVTSPIFGDATFGPPALMIASAHAPWELTNKSACNWSKCYFTFLEDVRTFRVAKKYVWGVLQQRYHHFEIELATWTSVNEETLVHAVELIFSQPSKYVF